MRRALFREDRSVAPAGGGLLRAIAGRDARMDANPPKKGWLRMGLVLLHDHDVRARKRGVLAGAFWQTAPNVMRLRRAFARGRQTGSDGSGRTCEWAIMW